MNVVNERKAAAIKAGRLMLQEIAHCAAHGESFAFETTLSGRSYAQKIPQWQALGYHVKLIFLNLPNTEMAIARVAARVAQGGHNIPQEVIRRRFNSGLHNFAILYKNIVDTWVIYDNSGSIPVLLDWGEKK